MKPCFGLRLCSLVFLLTPSILFASGVVKGVVVDSLTHEALVGAHVAIQGTALGSATDIMGNYAIRSVPSGRYTVRCSYVGYKMKERVITVDEGGTAVANFNLPASVVEGAEIVVTGQAVGQAAAINQQISSDKIVNVVSEQKIKELPDANAAEALGRLPGVSIVRVGGEAQKIILRGLDENLTTITLDGVQLSATDADSRGVDLSTIAQGALSGIVLTKAITSDMDGAAIAGNVNFVTKTAPANRLLSVTAQGSYGAMDNTCRQFNLYGTYGERFFENMLGVQVFGNMEQRNRSSENYSVSIDQSLYSYKDYRITDFTIQYVPETRKRRGVKLILDVVTPDDGVIKFSADANRTERRLSYISRDYPVDWATPVYSLDGQKINTEIRTFALQGENHIYGWDLNWDLSFTQSTTNVPYNYQLNFEEPSLTTSTGVVTSGMRQISPSLYKGPVDAFIPYAMNNFSAAYLQYAYARTSNSLDFQRTALFDAKKDYTFLDLSGQLKLGGKVVDHYHRRVSSYYYAPYYNGSQLQDYVLLADGSIVAKDYAAYGFGNLKLGSSQKLVLLTNFFNGATRNVYGTYALNPIIDANIVQSFYDLCINGINAAGTTKEYAFGTTEAGTDYGAKEDVSAGYVMNTLNFGRMATLVVGVRVEADRDQYVAYYTPSAINTYSVFSDTTAKHAESAVLPNVHLVVHPTDFMNVRLAAYEGITRPNFNYRLPTYVIVGTSAYVSTPQATLGNPNLKNSHAWNYDVNTQFYGEKIGLFSLSAFYKEIRNQVLYMSTMIYDKSTIPAQYGVTFINNTLPFGSTSFTLNYPYNSNGATKVWGFEVEHQMNFLWLPFPFNGLTLGYNASFVKSETQIMSSDSVIVYYYLAGIKLHTIQWVPAERKGPLTNSPEFFGNVAIGYDIAGFSARLSYFYQGEYHTSYSSNNYNNYVQKSFGRLDLSLKQGITNQFSVGLNINNLTDAEEGVYLANDAAHWRVQTSSWRYGTTADMWLKFTL